MIDAGRDATAKPRVIRLRREVQATFLKDGAEPEGSDPIYIGQDWRVILATWPADLQARQAEIAAHLASTGWNAGAAAYLAYERIATELFEARAERIAKGNRGRRTPPASPSVVAATGDMTSPPLVLADRTTSKAPEGAGEGGKTPLPPAVGRSEAGTSDRTGAARTRPGGKRGASKPTLWS